jgi:PKHD-type hydroxylase|tara:strand:+ start:170 stop:799 length:630 start_codon:yes stop_codon:yes gene_type:complete
MKLKNSYWYFTSAIKESLCDDIVSHAKKLKSRTASIDGIDESKLTKEKTIDLKKTRDSNIVWMNDSWIYELIIPYIDQANVNAEWNFDWDFLEECQFTTYKKDQHYDWHIDSFDEPYNKPNNLKEHGKIRKLSVTLNLSNPEEYTGGELEFYLNNGSPNGRESDRQICREILPKGSMVVFPSHVWHRVKPITSGERRSLVIWNLGYPFK